MPDTEGIRNSGNTTIRGHFGTLVQQYEDGVLKGQFSGNDEDLDRLVRGLIPQFENLWHQMSVIGVVSPNEDLEEVSTPALELLWTPFIIADLYQRLRTPLPQSSSDFPAGARGTSDNNDTTNNNNKHKDNSSSDIVRCGGITREEALDRSTRWLEVLFQWAVDFGLVDERTLETHRHYRADQRTQRVELSRTCRDLEQQWHRAADRAQYLRVRRRRLRELSREDEEEDEEKGEEKGEKGECRATEAQEEEEDDEASGDGDEEEARRDAALARLRWAVHEGCRQQQLTSRESAMLRAVLPEQRAAIATAHQRTLDAVGRGELSLGRHTYTILPGGLIQPGMPGPRTAQLSRDARSAIASQQEFRRQVVEELMWERNQPTMTLREFADAELADVQRRMDAAAEAQRRQEEEDERLGPEGVEERQRQRDAALENWKEDNPPIGKTARGNYT